MDHKGGLNMSKINDVIDSIPLSSFKRELNATIRESKYENLLFNSGTEYKLENITYPKLQEFGHFINSNNYDINYVCYYKLQYFADFKDNSYKFNIICLNTSKLNYFREIS